MTRPSPRLVLAAAPALALSLAAARPAAADGTDDDVTPIQVGASGYASAFGYVDHPERHEGGETQARVDVWRGLGWGAHYAYTLDVVNLTSLSSGSRGTSPYQDMNLGGSIAYHLGPVPLWSFFEGHTMVGSSGYGTGGAIYGGLGAAWQHVHAELGVGGTWVTDNAGLTVDLKVSRQHLTPWLGVAALAVFTDTSPKTMTAAVTGGARFAAGGEVSLGPWDRLTVTLDGLVGERALALTQRGQFVENLADVQRETVRAFLWIDVTPRLRAYVGAQLRTATAPADSAGSTSSDYVLASGFAGGNYTF